MEKLILGIDNGTTGTVCMIRENGDDIFFIESPVKFEQSYTKKKQNISRIDTVKLREVLEPYRDKDIYVMAVVERPLVNPSPKLFKTTMSAMRSLEATLCIIEEFKFSLIYCDSKEWQKELLPRGTQGTQALKKASLDIASRLFPKQKDIVKKHKDGDALLIAEWARRHKF